ncbi:MAG: hypothetical protein R3B93_01160 [Bacteroidia bacterium]
MSGRPVVEAGPDRNVLWRYNSVVWTCCTTLTGPNYTYIWTPAARAYGFFQSGAYCQSAITTTYFLIATSNGCPRSVADSVTIDVNLPAADRVVAANLWWRHLQLNGITQGRFYGNIIYRWSPGLGPDDLIHPHLMPVLRLKRLTLVAT